MTAISSIGNEKTEPMAYVVIGLAAWKAIDLTLIAANYGFKAVKAIGWHNIAGNIASIVAMDVIGKRVIPKIHEINWINSQPFTKKQWEYIDLGLKFALSVMATKTIFYVVGGISLQYAVFLTGVRLAIDYMSAPETTPGSEDDEANDEIIELKDLSK